MLRRLLMEWREKLCSCPPQAGYGHWADCAADILTDADIDELSDVMYGYIRTLFDLEVGALATERRIAVVGSDDPE